MHAHPDDETLTTGATIAHYVSRGAQVQVVTCTLGEEGEVIGERWVLDYQRRWMLLALALGILLLEAVAPDRRRMPTPAAAT